MPRRSGRVAESSGVFFAASGALLVASTKSTRSPAETGRGASDGTRGLLDALARTAMSQMAGTPRRSAALDGDAAADFLTASVLDVAGYSQSSVLTELSRRGFDAIAILDICVPKSAERLGAGWVNDDLTFTQVSAGASRLFGLCKTVGQEWDNFDGLNDDSLSILLVSFRREDHVLGPGILAQQLRRRGHSVRTLANTDASAVAERLAAGRHDCVMVSAASLVALAATMEELAALRRRMIARVPIALGGRALDYAGTIDTEGYADIVTSDPDLALSELARLRNAGSARGTP